jgi:hypothetical protein
LPETSCSSCGATIPADSLFYERCGQPLGGAPPEPLPYEPAARPYESRPSRPARLSVAATARGRWISNVQVGTGKEFTEYFATVTNISDPGRTINPFFWTLIDSSNKQYGIHVTTFITMKVLENSRPGQKTSGILRFEIPHSVRPVSLVYNDGDNILTIAL